MLPDAKSTETQRPIGDVHVHDEVLLPGAWRVVQTIAAPDNDADGVLRITFTNGERHGFTEGIVVDVRRGQEEARRPIEDVRANDALLLPSVESWREVQTIAAADHNGLVRMTFAGGEQFRFTRGVVLTVRCSQVPAPPPAPERPAPPARDSHLPGPQQQEVLPPASGLPQQAALPVAPAPSVRPATPPSAPGQVRLVALADEPKPAEREQDRAERERLDAIGHAPTAPAPETPATNERRAILDAMSAADWDISQAAYDLGVHPQKLEERIVAAGLTKPVCCSCYRDQPRPSVRCECGAANWIAIPISTDGSPNKSASASRQLAPAATGAGAPPPTEKPAFCGPVVRTTAPVRPPAPPPIFTPPKRTVPQPPLASAAKPAPRRPARSPSPTSIDYSGRVLAAVEQQDLGSARAVFQETGGNKRKIFETVKAMLADGRLVTDADGTYCAGSRPRGAPHNNGRP